MAARNQPRSEGMETGMQTELLSRTFDAVINVPHTVECSVELGEERLVAEAQHGSVEAFQILVSRYESRIFRLAERIVHSREDAEEVMQDAFVQAYKNLPRFRGDSRFYTWLARITFNAGLMKKRHQRFNEISIDVQPEDGFVPDELRDWGPNPEQRYSQEELHTILETTIAQLSPGCRMVFQLRDVEGFSTEETAQALSLSPTAVKSRVCRARLQLQKLLSHYFNPKNRELKAGGVSIGSRAQSSFLTS
jgi:RNA polymerase sigma-70 factor, ECF subfamily